MKSWIDDAPSDYNVYSNGAENRFYIHKTAKLGNVTIGRFSYVNDNTVLAGAYPIIIGAFTSIAAHVYCWTNENHQTRFVSSYPLRTVLGANITYSETVDTNQNVAIGSDVWIGREARILPGVTIGDGCVIGARAVVSRDCEPYGIYVGTPARCVRKRCSPEIVEQLLALRWWTWTLEKIKNNTVFFSIDISTFTGNLADSITL